MTVGNAGSKARLFSIPSQLEGYVGTGRARASNAQARTAPCDLWAQVYGEGKEEIDWRRFWVFMIFGAVYVGVFQYYVRASQSIPTP